MGWELPSKATELLWTHLNSVITSEILSFERAAIVFQDDNFIHGYRPINIRYIFFGCY